MIGENKGLNVLNNDKDAKKYQNHTFTEEGHKILENFTNQLVRWYMEKDRKFPFKMGMILGLPMMNYAQPIESKAKLLERIKAYGMILGKKEFVVKVGDSAHTILKLDTVEEGEKW